MVTNFSLAPSSQRGGIIAGYAPSGAPDLSAIEGTVFLKAQALTFLSQI
ncbi:MAG: hypothetical protein OSB02_09300 [Rhodospirillaceae bacterium]|nr:hypothetical protein [Rhodospirillaceae bacterium]